MTKLCTAMIQLSTFEMTILIAAFFAIIYSLVFFTNKQLNSSAEIKNQRAKEREENELKQTEERAKADIERTLKKIEAEKLSPYEVTCVNSSNYFNLFSVRQKGTGEKYLIAQTSYGVAITKE